MTIDAQGGTAPGVRRRLASARFNILWLAPVLALIAVGAWVFASPLGSAPDDDFHLASIWCAGTTEASTCAPGPEAGERLVPSALLDSPCYAHQGDRSAACQGDSLEDSTSTEVSTRGNFKNNYPPVYYTVMSFFAGDDFVASALLMRIVNVILFVAMTSALFCLLPRARKPTLLSAWMITTVPLGIFLIASNNPSSWAIIGVGSAWLALLGYFESEGRRKVALGALFVVAALIASGARGDAAIYIVLSVGVVGILTFALNRRYLLSAILPVLVTVVAIAFYFSSLQSTVSVSGLGDPELDGPAPSDKFSLLATNLLNIPSLWVGIFAGDGWGLGWIDTAMPAVVSFGALAVFIAMVFTGLRDVNWRKTLAVTLVALVLWLLPAYVLTAGNNPVGHNVQPRYILPLFLVLAGLAVMTIGIDRLRLSAPQAVFSLVALAVAQSVALHANMGRYLTDAGSSGWNLNQGIQWWWDTPVSPMTVWIAGSLAFAALVAILIREVVRPHAVTD